jgi:hypothetical protein
MAMHSSLKRLIYIRGGGTNDSRATSHLIHFCTSGGVRITYKQHGERIAGDVAKFFAKSGIGELGSIRNSLQIAVITACSKSTWIVVGCSIAAARFCKGQLFTSANGIVVACLSGSN